MKNLSIANKIIYSISFIYAILIFLFPDTDIGKLLMSRLKYLGVILVALIVVTEILLRIKKNEK